MNTYKTGMILQKYFVFLIFYTINYIGGDFPGGPVVKNPPYNAGENGFHPWSGN